MLKRKKPLKAKKGFSGNPTAMRRKEFVTKSAGAPPEEKSQRLLFLQLYTQQKGKCMVSGRTLLPPEHDLFHCQGSHCLPKGTYPNWKFRRENIVMILKEYHDEWNLVKEKSEAWLQANDKAHWIPVVLYFQALREHEYDIDKPLPAKPPVPTKIIR